jgi:hypothetical protein
MHQMPHLDSKLNTVDNKFAISADSAYNEYTRSLVIFPSILGGIGVLVLLGYLIGLLSRFCCQCCWAPQTRSKLDSKPSAVNHNKRNLTIAFMTVIVVILGFDFGILGGNKSLNTGISRAIDAVDFVGDIFQSKPPPPSICLSHTLMALTLYLTHSLSLSVVSLSLCVSLS